MPHGRAIQIFDRLEQLKRKIDEMMDYHDHLERMLKKEKMVTTLSELLRQGQDHISNLRQWVATNYPKTSQDTNAPKARELAAYTMQWYINLVTSWDTALEELCCV